MKKYLIALFLLSSIGISTATNVQSYSDKSKAIIFNDSAHPITLIKDQEQIQTPNDLPDTLVVPANGNKVLNLYTDTGYQPEHQAVYKLKDYPEKEGLLLYSRYDSVASKMHIVLEFNALGTVFEKGVTNKSCLRTHNIGYEIRIQDPSKFGLVKIIAPGCED